MHPRIDYFRPFPRLTGNYTNNASREIIYKMEENSRMEDRWGTERTEGQRCNRLEENPRRYLSRRAQVRASDNRWH